MEKPASIAELSAPVETLPTAVSVASGKKQTLSLPSTSGTYDAGQKQPTKDRIRCIIFFDCIHIGSTQYWTGFFPNPPSYCGRAY